MSPRVGPATLGWDAELGDFMAGRPQPAITSRIIIPHRLALRSLFLLPRLLGYSQLAPLLRGKKWNLRY